MGLSELLKVGDPVWLRDDHRRHYDKKSRLLIERESYVCVEVTEVGSRSITLSNDVKLDRKTGEVRGESDRSRYGSRNTVFSEAGLEDRLFLVENRHVIANAVLASEDAESLRVFARVLGVEVKRG
jgi:hypothetical protein